MTLSMDSIRAAHDGIRPEVAVTPLMRSNGLSMLAGCDVLLKCDHLQATGSFKLRGATNKLRLLTPAQREAGVITASTGNHGQAVAWAGARLGVDVAVYVATGAAPGKLNAIAALGARVVQVAGNPMDAELEARRQAGLQGRTYVSPYNDLEVMAGQGTLGLELAEQAPDLAAVFIATGGGGLIGGSGTALRGAGMATRVVGVWPERSQALLRALEAGEIIDVAEQPTLSDGTAGAVEPGSVTFPVCQRVVDERMTVTEAEIAAAMRLVALHDHWMIEGAAGVAVAGLLKAAAAYRGKRIAAVLCGRNIGLGTYLNALNAA